MTYDYLVSKIKPGSRKAADSGECGHLHEKDIYSYIYICSLNLYPYTIVL